MKRIVTIAALVLIALAGGREFGFSPTASNPGTEVTGQASDALLNAYERKARDVQVRGEGEVVKVLRDDTEGSRHQRFILRTSTGQTVLVAHNIDLAERISRLKSGDRVEFYGEYEWSPKGGVIHWTHHDPQGWHQGGWLKHKGVTYQ